MLALALKLPVPVAAPLVLTKSAFEPAFDPALEPVSGPASSARLQSWDAKRWSLCDVAARAPYEDNVWEGRELITAFGGDRLEAGFTNRPSGVVSKPRCEILRDVMAVSLREECAGG